MGLFNTSEKIKTNVKLVSLHIPKTAGTSFRNILKEVYGEEHVARIDIRSQVELNEEVFTGSKLKRGIHVLHGHFSCKHLTNNFDISRKAPFITWIREPAERVISNYYYLEKVLINEVNEEAKGLNILSKMQKSLIEYASAEANRNRISKFLHGMAPEEFYFIGLTEHYKEDLEQLSDMLGWKDFKIFEHNITGDKPEIDEETLDKIRRLNEVDYEIYEQAIELREERMKLKA
ncbi:MAG: sulfotransferase family 2 domain-containing protein [Bacteroidota bacterium]